MERLQRLEAQLAAPISHPSRWLLLCPQAPRPPLTRYAQQLWAADGSRRDAISSSASSAEEQGQAWVRNRLFFTSTSLLWCSARVVNALRGAAGRTERQGGCSCNCIAAWLLKATETHAGSPVMQWAHPGGAAAAATLPPPLPPPARAASQRRCLAARLLMAH